MTIEEKAKRYDEAFGIARNVWRFSSNNAEIMRMEELFPELKESEDEKIRNQIINFIEEYGNPIHCEWQKDWIAWLEKQVEQKSADKVEPKFHEGDWAVFNNHHDLVFQVEKIENYEYTLRHFLGVSITLPFSHEDIIRAWTIQDAKDGDIVVVPSIEGTEHSEQIFIFKEIKNRDYVKNVVEYYCRVCDNEFYVNERGFMGQSDDYFVPATKEQRDTLFAKMKEAGYEWDEETHELKKIEQKSSWSEEDEENMNFLCGLLTNLQVESTEDEIKYGINSDSKYYYDIKEWLKSLRPQKQWKPTEEQMYNLSEAAHYHCAFFNRDILISLYDDLAKL